jgi:AcrR family transcriptional regulator
LEPPIRRKTQVERRDEAETALLRSAVKLVAEKGYDGFTLADVADDAGYSRGLPAHYFGKKEDLLSLVAEKTAENYILSLAKLPPVDRGLPKIEAVIRSYVRAYGVATRALCLLVAHSMVVPKLRQTVMKLNNDGLAFIMNEIQAGIELGNIRSDVNVKKCAATVYSFLRGAISLSTADPSFDSIETGEEFIESFRRHVQSCA